MGRGVCAGTLSAALAQEMGGKENHHVIQGLGSRGTASIRRATIGSLSGCAISHLRQSEVRARLGIPAYGGGLTDIQRSYRGSNLAVKCRSSSGA
jgi:hypothetical protein